MTDHDRALLKAIVNCLSNMNSQETEIMYLDFINCVITQYLPEN